MALVATGFFDGVHLGHRFLLDMLVGKARERGEDSVVATFWPHPRAVLQNDARNFRLLSDMEEKKEMITALGVDRIVVLPFSKSFASLSAEEYLAGYIRDRLGGTGVLLGYDNRLGSDLVGAEQAVEIASKVGLEAVLAPKSGEISSTRIRKVLEEGDPVSAAKMLGYDYTIRGAVVPGEQRGRTLGFPTANLQVFEPLKLIPGNGVYLVRVGLDERNLYGVCNVGVRPTVGRRLARTIETNILDFDEDIYGLPLTLTFLRRIRDEKRFLTFERLKRRIAEDKETAKAMLSEMVGMVFRNDFPARG